MATLLSLPPETLSSICSYLGQGDKAAVVHTARGLYGVASTALYENLDWFWSEPECDEIGYLSDTTYVDKRCPIHLLLRTSFERPHLVQRTKHVRFRGWKAGRMSKDDFGDKTFQQILSALRQSNLADSAETVNGETWMMGLNKGSVDYCIAIFILQLHNLETLFIGHDYGNGLEWLCAMFRFIFCTERASPTVSRFTKLRRVELFNDLISRCMVVYHCVQEKHLARDILPFCYLPNLQDLRAVWPRETASFAWPRGMPPPTTHLTRLHLRRSDFEPQHLRYLLKTTPVLHHLRYDFRTLFGYMNLPVFDCDDFTKAFEEVSQSLISLVLCLQLHKGIEEGDGHGADNLTMKGHASFANLINLEKLEVPIIVLAGTSVASDTQIADRIPHSALKELALRDDLAHTAAFPWRGRQLTDCIESYAARMQSDSAFGMIPDFELVLQESRARGPFRCNGPEGHVKDPKEDEWDTYTLEVLHAICQEAGIQFSIRDEPIGGDRIYRPYKDYWIDGTPTGHPVASFYWE